MQAQLARVRGEATKKKWYFILFIYRQLALLCVALRLYIIDEDD